MADTIPGQQIINIGLQNESVGSDSLYTAFHKVKTNFATLFSNASPYTTFTGNTGISVAANSTAGTVDITNTGVTYIQAGTGISITGNTGNITISSAGGNGNGFGTVTSVAVSPVSNTRLVVSGSPIVSSGTISIDLAPTGATAGTYTYPTVTIDSYGRITNIANATSVGTVTSIGVTPGFGIQVTGGPITTAGNITILNTGVTRLSAGAGIALSGSNGNVTISTTTASGTVTSVGVSSSTLTVTGSPVVAAGTIGIELPSDVSINTIAVATDANVGNLRVSGATGSIGYAPGAGGSVTQLTSRTTGVTINKPTGSIALYNTAGSASYQTFVVTNSVVEATDIIIVNQKSGTDQYLISVTGVNAGSFSITFATTGGTAAEAPVFSFAVIKGAII